MSTPTKTTKKATTNITDGVAGNVTEMNGIEQPSVAPGVDPTLASSGDDLSAFRYDQSFADGATITLTTMVPTRKPGKQAFIWLHPAQDWSFNALALEVGEDMSRIMYLLHPKAASAIDVELVKPVCLRVYTDRDGVVALWPVTMSSATGRSNTWSESARDIAFSHTERWLKVFPSQGHGGNIIKLPTAVIPPPKDPPTTMMELVKIAFKGRFITDTDHIVLKKLRGEV